MPGKKGDLTIDGIHEGAKQSAQADQAPGRVRRTRTVFFQASLIAVAAAFAVLTVLVIQTPSFAIDLQISRLVQSIDSPFFATLMGLISWPGFSPQAMIIAGLVVLWLWFIGQRWEAVAAAIASVLPTAVNLLTKDLVHRPRPTPALVRVVDSLTSYSFPSGHVMFYVGFFGFISYLIFTQYRSSLRRTLLLIGLNFLILTIGLSRVYLGGHWASDVLGAYLLGSLVLLVEVYVFNRGKGRFFVRSTKAGESPEDTAPVRRRRSVRKRGGYDKET